jgi:plasmid replication initiation protein
VFFKKGRISWLKGRALYMRPFMLLSYRNGLNRGFLAMSKKTPRQLVKVEKARAAVVYQADTLLQKGRFELTLTEQRLILYAISQIKPTDTKREEYTFRLKDFYDICGIKEKDDYTAIKKTLVEMRKKVWWITMEDPHEPGTECESAVSWFEIIRTNKRSGSVTIGFHVDMVPYLLELARQREEGKGFYTQFTFQYILPMRSQYSVRLYELLKSYQKNNIRWWFKLDELKRLLDCMGYKAFKDFRVRVLDIAMKEINEYSDLRIKYETGKDGKRVSEVTFYMANKTTIEQIEAQKKGLTALDGEIHYWDSEILPGQINLFGQA